MMAARFSESRVPYKSAASVRLVFVVHSFRAAFLSFDRRGFRCLRLQWFTNVRQGGDVQTLDRALSPRIYLREISRQRISLPARISSASDLWARTPVQKNASPHLHSSLERLYP